MIGFEVNTDRELIDPDWNSFEETHNRQYGLAISYVKSVVKGESFDNEVMNLTVGKTGFYLQSKNFPAAFYGETAHVSYHFVSEQEARALVFEAVALYRNKEARSMTCIYSNAAPHDVFFGYHFDNLERYELGFLQVALPLHLRININAKEKLEIFDDLTGVFVYQRTADGRHLVIKSPGKRQPFLLLNGFSA
ncbi:MAG TPA: hypothetical protein ENK21_00950 [Trueperaceae bacterium]|nr:hypothetical protein [Trueperaceae bacterium]